MRRRRILTLTLLAGSLSFSLAQSASAFSPFGTQHGFEPDTDADSVPAPTQKANTSSPNNESYGSGYIAPGETGAAADFVGSFGSFVEETTLTDIDDNPAYQGPSSTRDGTEGLLVLYRGDEGTYDSVSYGPFNRTGRSSAGRPSTDPFGYSVDLWLSPNVVVGGTTDPAGSPDWLSTTDPAFNENPSAPPRADNPGIQEFLWTNALNNTGGTNMGEAGVYAFAIDTNGAEAGGVAWKFVPQGPEAPITLDADQWVTLEMTFDDDGANNILATLRILNADHTAALYTHTRAIAGASAADIGGLRYSWFTGMDYSIDRLFVDNWQSGGQIALTPIPEPASLGLLAAGSLMMLRRRRTA
jgi:hypothetical protein